MRLVCGATDNKQKHFYISRKALFTSLSNGLNSYMKFLRWWTHCICNMLSFIYLFRQCEQIVVVYLHSTQLELCAAGYFNQVEYPVTSQSCTSYLTAAASGQQAHDVRVLKQLLHLNRIKSCMWKTLCIVYYGFFFNYR